MDKDLIQSIGIIFSMLLGIAVLGFNIWQIRMLSKQLELSTQQLELSSEQAKVLTKQVLVSTSATLASQLNELNQLKFEHPEFLEEQSGEYTLELEHSRTGLMAHMRLNLFEQVYIQHQQELINDSAFLVWQNYMKWTFQTPFACGHWQANREFYGDNFREMIDEIVKVKMPGDGNAKSEIVKS